MQEKEKLKEIYKSQLNSLINRVENIISICEYHGFTNEQFYIEFEDKLNKLSVKDHGNCKENF